MAEKYSKLGSPDNINLRSDDYEDALGVPPKWILRRGISVFFIIIIALLVFSTFFKYPDTIVATAIITSSNPPSTIISKADGKITKIFYPEGSIVNNGDTIGVIENSASLKDMNILFQFIKSFNLDSTKSDFFHKSIYSNRLNLGEIQEFFNSFSKACKNYAVYAQLNYHEKKIQALELENNNNLKYAKELMLQEQIIIKDYELTRNQFLRDSLLFNDRVISTIDYEKSFANVLQKKQVLKSAQINILNCQMNFQRVRNNIIDLKMEQETQRASLKEEVKNTYDQLLSSLSLWEKKYLLISPSCGVLSYMNIRSNLQEVKNGDPIFTVNPAPKGEIFGIVSVPFSGVGKIRQNETVNIKLDGYPYMEFGVVKGLIQSVSSGSTDKGYPTKVYLQDGAITSYGYKLNTDRNLTGIAEIVTDDLTLLQRLLSPVKYIWKTKTTVKFDQK